MVDDVPLDGIVLPVPADVALDGALLDMVDEVLGIAAPVPGAVEEALGVFWLW
jgi:hypothetical protein